MENQNHFLLCMIQVLDLFVVSNSANYGNTCTFLSVSGPKLYSGPYKFFFGTRGKKELGRRLISTKSFN